MGRRETSAIWESDVAEANDLPFKLKLETFSERSVLVTGAYGTKLTSEGFGLMALLTGAALSVEGRLIRYRSLSDRSKGRPRGPEPGSRDPTLLIGGLRYVSFEKRITLGSLLAGVEDGNCEQTAGRGVVLTLAGGGEGRWLVPPHAGVVGLLHHRARLATDQGQQRGIRRRVPAYRDLGTFLGGRQLTPHQRALLFQLEPGRGSRHFPLWCFPRHESQVGLSPLKFKTFRLTPRQVSGGASWCHVGQ